MEVQPHIFSTLKYINGRPVCHKQGETYAFFQNKRLDRSVKPFYLFLNTVIPENRKYNNP